jgi:hypothetical protein
LDVIPLKHLKYGTLLVGVAMALASNLNTVSQADCHTNYTQAVTLLDIATQQAANNQHPDPDAFSNDFKALITRMQTEKCMPELMSLIQHIQAEQKKLPASSGPPAKPNPVMD